MKIDGSIVTNLRAAVRSSERLKGSPVYPETLQFWQDLLAFARGDGQVGAERMSNEFLELTKGLEGNLKGRTASAGGFRSLS